MSDTPTPNPNGLTLVRGDIATRFQPGQVGNPGGRPVGARQKLAAGFIKALHDSFLKDGLGAIDRLCREDPGTYIKVIASMLPRDLIAIDGDGGGLRVVIRRMDAEEGE